MPRGCSAGMHNQTVPLPNQGRLSLNDAVENDFNSESRIQSQARINRPGSRGSNIIDILNLPTDQLVLNNLQKKFDLQAMTMGEIRDAIEYAAVNIRRLV